MTLHRSTASGRSLAILATALMAAPLVFDHAVAACRDRTPTSWDLDLAPAGEPGQRLVLSGRVVTGDRRTPVPGATIYVYHADAAGQYNTAGNEGLEPRLCGVLRTNARGEYRIRTVMPGGTGPHLHVELFGGGVRHLQTAVMLVRANREPVTSANLKERITRYERHSDSTENTRPVYQEKDGTLSCTRNFVVEWRDPATLPVMRLPKKN